MPRVKQFDRQEVLEKAMDLFWKKGFHATSIEDLVNHCGINRASMYNAFGGKEQLFDEAFQFYRQKNMAYFLNLEELLAQKTVRKFLEEYLKNGLENIVTDQDRKGCMVVNATTELGNQKDAVWKLLHQNLTQVTELYAEIIRIGQDRGEISKDQDPEQLAQHLYTFYSGLNVVAKVEENPDRLHAIIDLELNYIFK